MQPKTTPLELEPMQAAVAAACKLLKTLGNPERLLLLCQLSQGEYCVGDLQAMLGISQPTLSQQLGVLRAEALVATRREGKLMFYSLASKEARAVLAVLYAQFCATWKRS